MGEVITFAIITAAHYHHLMIKTFGNAETHDLFTGKRVHRWINIESVAMRKLAMLNRAAVLGDLRVPPANRLEALKGDRKGQYSIRVNDQFRICFQWKDGDAYDVGIVDYH